MSPLSKQLIPVLYIKIVKIDQCSKLMPDTIIDETYIGFIHTSSKSPERQAWLISKGIKTIRKDDRVSVYLEFRDNLNIGDLTTDKVKSTIDCLYPILDSIAGSLEDWKIEEFWVVNNFGRR